MGPGAALARGRFVAGTYRQVLRAAWRLRRTANAAHGNPEALVELAFSFSFGPISAQPAQVPVEIEELVRLVKQLAPQRVLEIGTANGGTLFLFARVAADRATIVSLDIRRFDATRRFFYRSFARRRQRVIPLQADSQTEATVTLVRELFSGQPLDMVFIDGDHSYEGVRRDFELYAPLVRAGGLVALHDIVHGAEELVGGVPQFWEELRESATTYQEIVADWNQGGWGLGIVRREALDLSQLG
jgi:predicted O-methyltransferase YrrM